MGGRSETLPALRCFVSALESAMNTEHREHWVRKTIGLVVVLGVMASTGCSDPPPPTVVTPEPECDTYEDCDDDEYCNVESNTCEPVRNRDSNNGGSDGNGDDFEPCEVQGQPCDGSEIDQGNFWCLPELGEDGECVAKCDTPGRAGSCLLVEDGTYCMELDAEGRAGCYPSECTGHTDCDGGTCANYGQLGNNFGRCFSDGAGESGDSCSGGPGGECVEGSVCLAGTDGSERCRQLCDPWDGGCMEWNEVCAPLQGDLGYCTANIDTQSSDAFDPCYTQGAWCSNAVRCMAGGAGYMCIRYCRAGHNDCDPITGEETRCNPYIVPGNNLGLCLPPCQSDGDCSDSEVCVEETCRVSCTHDSECCPADNPDCASVCADGYCM